MYFSGDLKDIDGGRKFSNIVMMELVQFCRGSKNFNGETTETWRGKLLISNLAGKQAFLAGLPSTLAGQCFGGVVTGGVFRTAPSPYPRPLT